MKIGLVETDDAIRRCFGVMSQLRPHISADEFIPRVRRQMESGYRLASVTDAEKVVAVAGFRIGECLAWGRHLYVDDLVTADGERSRGFGKALFDWLVAFARKHGCEQFHLDSGVQRFDAHRFYLRHGMHISSHHFSLRIDRSV
jgi:GNAT superfamily N-acetyltransferase